MKYKYLYYSILLILFVYIITMSTNNDMYTFTPSSVDKMVIGKYYTVGSGENERVSKFESKTDITEDIKKRDSTIPDNIKYYDLNFEGRVVTVIVPPRDGDDVIKEATLKEQDGGRRRSYRKITVRKSRKSISRNNNKSHRLRNSRKRRYSRRR